MLGLLWTVHQKMKNVVIIGLLFWIQTLFKRTSFEERNVYRFRAVMMWLLETVIIECDGNYCKTHYVLMMTDRY